MGKSLKQQWVSERLFTNYGSLKGIETRLDQIARASSTLPCEADALFRAAQIIHFVNLKTNRDESWIRFQARRT